MNSRATALGWALPRFCLLPQREVMPLLNPIPLDTTIPGHTRRRLWSHPELSSHSVLVLTFDRFYLAPLSGSPKPETLAAIEAGADLDIILGPLTTVIDLEYIRQLSLDLLTNSLAIEYAGKGSKKSRLRLTFATPEAADACFTKIWRRLGNEFQLAPYKRDAWHSIRSPLALLSLILFSTALVAGLLSIHEDMASTPLNHARWTNLVNWLNWRVVCGVGGAAAAGSQIWLYRRLTTPPESLELIKL